VRGPRQADAMTHPADAGANDNDIVLHQVHSSWLASFQAGGALAPLRPALQASEALVRTTTTTASAGRLHLTRAGVKRGSKASSHIPTVCLD